MDVLVDAGKMFVRFFRRLFKFAWAIVVAVALQVPIAIRFDAPQYVGDPETIGTDKPTPLPKGITTGRIWFSVWTWLVLLPILVWLAQGIHTGLLLALLIVVPVGTFLFARRVSASKHSPMTLGEWQMHLGHLLRPELPDEPEEPAESARDAEPRVARKAPKARVQNRYQVLLIAYLLMSLAAIGVALSTLILKDLPADIAVVIGHALPWYPLGALVAHIALFLPIAAKAAVLHSEYDDSDGGTTAHLEGKLARVLGISINDWIGHGASFEMAVDLRTITVAPTPVPALEKLGAGLEERLEAYFGDWTVKRADRDEVVFVTIDQIPEIAASRRIRDESDGVLVGIADAADSELRPETAVWSLNPAWRGKADLIDGLAKSHGLRLVAYDDVSREAVVARPSRQVQELRARIAGFLNCAEWDVELTTDGQASTTQFTIHRAPKIHADAEQRSHTWLTIANALATPPALSDWKLDDQTTLGQGLSLRIVADPLREVLTYPWDAPVTHRAIPFGVDEQGQPVTLGLLESNLLLGGIPGGGKSGGVSALLSGISRLEHVALIGLDPKKVELPGWRARFTRIATERDESLEIIDALNAEMDRRYQWLMDSGLKKFTAEMFTAERPMVIMVIDEMADLVSMGNGKDEKDEDLLRSSGIQRLIAMGRAAGVVVIAATQKPEGSVIPTKLRDLIAQRVAYSTSTRDMTNTILGAGMDANGGLAHTIPSSLRGVCYLLNEESRVPLRARTYWIPDEEVMGISERTAHLRVELPWLAGGTPAPASPEIVDAGTFEFSLDDLDDETPIQIAPEFDFSLELAAPETPADALQPAPTAWAMPAAATPTLDADRIPR